MKEYLVSIIIPAYNAEAYLPECLDSILSQKNDIVEVIVINDGSKDGTKAICESFAKENERIQIIDKQNAGVSSARNDGLSMARAHWVMFVDSDDKLIGDVGDCLKDLPADCDLVLMGAQSEFGEIINPYVMYHEAYYNKLSDLLVEQPQSIIGHGAPWAKLYRRDLIIDNNIMFNENLSITEDRLFYYQYLTHVKGIKTCAQYMYSYLLTDGGLRCKRYPIEIQEYRLNALSQASFDIVESQIIDTKAVVVLQKALNSQCVAILQALSDHSFSEVKDILQKTIAKYPPFHLSLIMIIKLLLFRVRQKAIGR